MSLFQVDLEIADVYILSDKGSLRFYKLAFSNSLRFRVQDLIYSEFNTIYRVNLLLDSFCSHIYVMKYSKYKFCCYCY